MASRPARQGEFLHAAEMFRFLLALQRGILAVGCVGRIINHQKQELAGSRETESTTVKTRGGLRYCINSAALRFIHRDDMEAEGYGTYLNQVEDSHD